jgi:hypothetical protein
LYQQLMFDPLRQSRCVGVGSIPIRAIVFRSRPLLDAESYSSLPRLFLLLSGVGNNPHPVPDVRGSNVASPYATPLRIIPERGQVSENNAKSPSKQSCDVLHDDVSRSYLANNPGELLP